MENRTFLKSASLLESCIDRRSEAAMSPYKRGGTSIVSGSAAARTTHRFTAVGYRYESNKVRVEVSKWHSHLADASGFNS